VFIFSINIFLKTILEDLRTRWSLFESKTLLIVHSSYGWGHWNLLLLMDWHRDAISSFDVLIYMTPYWIKKYITSYRLIRNIKSKMILNMYVLVGPAPNVNLQYEPYCCIPQYWIELFVSTIIESLQEYPGTIQCKSYEIPIINFKTWKKKL
jgi:hypothetical protein